MAEGLLGGVLGQEEEKSDGDVVETAASAATGAEAFAAAVAAIASRQDPAVARDTSAFLQEQTQLLKVQKEHLKDEHALRMSHLHNVLREEKVRRLALRLRVCFQIFIALVLCLLGLGVFLMLHDAFMSKSVVVEPFESPADLVARGLTGKVVASGLLDELNRLQAATRTILAKPSLSNAWASDVKLALPEAGISIGEVSQLLKARFGHDVHIDGELVAMDGGGLALTVRGDGVPPITFSSAAGDLAKLTSQAAEHVYASSQPAVWAIYLSNTGRFAEAIAFCQAAFAAADKADRPYLLNAWANSLTNSGGSRREALDLFRTAVKLKPDFWIGYNNIMNGLWGLGDEEGAWKVGEDMRRLAGGRPGRAAEIYFENWDTLTWNLPAWLESTIADVERNGGVGTQLTSSAVGVAEIYARMHDDAAATLTMKTIKADPHDATIPAQQHFIRALLASDAGDWQAAAAEMTAYRTAFENPAVSSNFPGYNCWVAPALEAAGHPDDADSVLKSAGSYVDCYRFRADILDRRGDWRGAQKGYADAVALAPHLPAGYYSWGVALERHGNLSEAETKLKAANQRGPHWADPLKAWGDVLLKEGHQKDGLTKYDEALKYAPNWAVLEEAREATAKLKD